MPKWRLFPIGGGLSLAAFAAALALGCGSPTSGPAAKVTTLTATGSSTIAPLLAEIGKRYEAAHPGTRIEVQSGGSSRGVADARAGLAQVGMVSRAAKADESDLEFFLIARDGVAMIVHRDNPVPELTDPQVVDIYTGKIANWSAVGGHDAPITVVNKAEGRSTLELFLHHFKIDAKAVQADLIIGENQQGIKTVAGNPDAIAYVSIGTAEYEKGAGTPIRLLASRGVEASTAAVAAERFPLARPLNLVTRKDPPEEVRTFIDYCRSPAVDDLVQAQFFVPLPR